MGKTPDDWSKRDNSAVVNCYLGSIVRCHGVRALVMLRWLHKVVGQSMLPCKIHPFAPNVRWHFM